MAVLPWYVAICGAFCDATLGWADDGIAGTGQDNSNKECIVGDVPNIFEGDESDHDGPYDGITMGC